MNTVVYMRIATSSVARAMDRGGKTSVTALLFGGSSSCGMVPAGGTPAGPFMRAAMSADMIVQNRSEG